MFETSKIDDADPAETREWLESIDSVLKTQGSERAHYLLERIIDFTRRSGAYLPFKPNTAYVNTISTGQELEYPGDRALERRIEAYLRWNAMAMVVHANRQSSEFGGHMASYASAATLYEVGFNHFWRAPSEQHPGDMVFIQGHSAPGIYARAYLEGRLTRGPAEPLPRGSGRRPVVVSASVADAGLLAVPDGVDGPRPDDGDLPGALRALPRTPRHRAGERSQGLGFPRRRRDGRAGIARRDHDAGAREARQPRVRHQLQPAAARRPGARQRQDHPGTRSRLPRRGLERHQGGVGFALGSAAAAGHQGAAAPADDGMRRRRVPELQGQGRRVHAREFLRQVSGAEGNGRQPVRRGHLAPEPRRPRRAQGLQRLPGGHQAHGPADGHPRQDGEGLRHRPHRRRSAEHHAPAEEARRRCAARIPRPLQHPGVGRRTSRSLPYFRPAENSEETQVPAGAAQGARRLPAAAQRPRAAAQDAGARGVRAAARIVGRARDLDDDGVRAPARHPAQGQGDRLARRADRSRRGAHVRHGRHVPPDRHLFVDGPALHAAGRGPAAVLPRGQEGPDPRGRHQRRRRDVQLDRGGHGLREPRRQHGAVLHLLLDVRLPAHRRLRLGRGRHAGARLPARRHGGPHDAGGRRPAAPGRPQPAGRDDDPELRRVRPGVSPTNSR